MTISDIPDAFVWTKIHADAGQSIDDILRRKELERQSGGTFWWGVGQPLKEQKIMLLGQLPAVLFSLMLSKPHKRDRDPEGVLLWESYHSTGGTVPLPPHAIVISRAHDSKGRPKSRYYALVCANPAGIPHSNGRILDTRTLRNLGEHGRRIGTSQITAVVERSAAQPDNGHQYPTTVCATLVAPYFVKLVAPRLLSSREKRRLDEVSVDGKSLDDWIAVARELRRAAVSLREAQATIEQDRTGARNGL
jgi:hypothetical protein